MSAILKIDINITNYKYLNTYKESNFFRHTFQKSFLLGIDF